MTRFFLILALGLALPATASAQNSTYSTWSNPANPTSTAPANSDATTLADKLNALVDKAEKAKAADPVFLRDLRALANSYSAPSLKIVFSDDFKDGEYTQNPTWQVISGNYFIESGWGLRNKIIQQNQPTQSSGQTNTGEDLAVALLGSILQQATGAQRQAAPAPVSSENLIASSVQISNAFILKMDISSWIAGGHFEAGVFQGSAAKTGYRVVYQSGQPLQIVKVGGKGRTLVSQSSSLLTLEDKKFHSINWSRNASGEMVVSADGQELIRVVDKSFSDAFDGVRISDQGGDFIVKKITVSGT